MDLRRSLEDGYIAAAGIVLQELRRHEVQSAATKGKFHRLRQPTTPAASFTLCASKPEADRLGDRIDSVPANGGHFVAKCAIGTGSSLSYFLLDSST